ncbi:hypothetical protein [Bacillus swezeyi]|uniref:hypothetical protein n=1 Tax=Bacillus swezeyi TaxID=1925020 RepID=UPI0012388429|nr:hypothetical protein [Bacillus swezeyi]KAA6472181.1 hypothetical protein DX928_22410 [Bacillus swezeyi]
MEERNVQGLIALEIIEDKEGLLEEFEIAFKEMVETYISTTPIKVKKIETQQKNGEIIVKYEFRGLSFHYKTKTRERSSSMNEAELGRAVFEFYTKLLVKTFFEKSLKVDSRHTEITISEMMRGRKSF